MRSALESARLKALGWRLAGWAVIVVRMWFAVRGRIREVDLLIYKIDRLGDWFLAEPGMMRLISEMRARGNTVVVWASDESAALRRWRPLNCAVETFRFEPRNVRERILRLAKLIHRLASVRARTLVCLRHAPDPVRDFVLFGADAREIRALSWRIIPGPLDVVPHEIRRHWHLLEGLGLAPADVRELLPRLDRPAAASPETQNFGRNQFPDALDRSRVAVAPFSSTQTKDWPEEGWITVTQALAARGFGVEFWVSAEQVARAEALAGRINRLGGKRIADVRSGSLENLTAALSRAEVVLSVDTFAAHLAAALDTPLVVLLGGGQFGEFGPWQRSQRQRWVSRKLPCYHCSWQCTRAQIDCMREISSTDVLNQLDELGPVSRPIGSDCKGPSHERIAG